MSKIASSRSRSRFVVGFGSESENFFNPAKVSKLKRLIFQSRIVFHRKVTKWRNFFDEEFLFCSKIKKGFQTIRQKFFSSLAAQILYRMKFFARKIICKWKWSRLSLVLLLPIGDLWNLIREGLFP